MTATMQSLQWQPPPISNRATLVQQAFPSFQIDSSSLGKGDVKVKAKSPSGRLVENSVAEVDGIFTANFTPTEVGDWEVSILYDNRNIEGSPFSVRVYDASKVTIGGMEGGIVGKSFSFTADSSLAGQGNLVVDITHNGNNVPSRIEQTSQTSYKITFMPYGSGVYDIQVFFANVPIRGSPFSLEIVDPSKVQLVEDLKSCLVGKINTILVKGDHGAKSSDINVQISAPNGSQLPVSGHIKSQNIFIFEYVPKQIGEHIVQISFMNRPIAGSPYRIIAFDASTIGVKNLPSVGLVGRSIEFDIDASMAGSGNLEILVNDGAVKCVAQNRGNKQFHAAFVPLEAGLHIVRMRFNEVELQNSPWSIDVKSIHRVRAAGSGLHGPIACHKEAAFEVDCGPNNEGHITCSITSSNGRKLPVDATKISNGIYRFSFTPKQPGSHQVDLKFEDFHIPGSPFTTKSFDASAIRLGRPSDAVIGKPVEMSIDVSAAGEGQLEIMVNGGQVPNTVRSAGNGQKGQFILTFVPKTAQVHYIDVKFNGESANNCPIALEVLDSGRVVARGEGLSNCIVDQQSSFVIDASATGQADLDVVVTAPNGSQLDFEMQENPKTKALYNITYTPKMVGKHTIEIFYGGLPIKGCPHVSRCCDSSKIVVSPIQDGYVGQKSKFIIDALGAGEGNMQIYIAVVGGRNIQNHVQQIGTGKFEVSFMPLDGAQHEASITFNSIHVKGSPFKFNVMDPKGIFVSGEGIGLVICKEETKFSIGVPLSGFKKKLLDVSLTDPEKRNIPIHISNDYIVSYTPTIVGQYEINVNYDKQPVTGSPFFPKAYDPTLVKVYDLKNGRTNQINSFTIDASKAGSGNIEIQVTVDKQNIKNFVKSEKTGICMVTFTPEMAADHYISVKFNNKSINGSPFKCSITDNSKLSLHGDGLRLAGVHEKAIFYLNAKRPLNELNVLITSPTGKKVTANLREQDDDIRIEYMATEVGKHSIEVRINDDKMETYYPEIYDIRNVKVGNIESGVVGKPVTFRVDCTNAGEGTLTVDIKSLKSDALTEIKPVSTAIYDVIFIPRNTDDHLIQITFNERIIDGCPFVCPIMDSSTVRVNCDNLHLVPVNQRANFSIDAADSSLADIAVEVYDVNGELINCRINNQPNRIMACEFIPKIVGSHTIKVQCGAHVVAGSPFGCCAYDANKVKLIDVQDNCKTGMESTFTVDTSLAGQGDLDVEVFCEGKLIRTVREKISNTKHSYKYIVQRPQMHEINVYFNLQLIPNCPYQVKMADPGQILTLNKKSPNSVASNQLAWATLSRNGDDNISKDDLLVKVKAPNGQMVPAKLVQQKDGNYKVEYSSIYTGSHTIEVLYGGLHVAGTPFKVEIYDPNKVDIKYSRLINVGERINIDINTVAAGNAEIGLAIKSPQNNDIKYEMKKTDYGYKLSYVPMENGNFKILATYGGLDLPGNPYIQTAKGIAGNVTVTGSGLFSAIVGKVTDFIIDGGGEGDLMVTVDGPNSPVKCSVSQIEDGKYRVKYIPIEIGNYLVTVKLNGQEIVGSPWKPKVLAPSKVTVTGGWQSHMDSKSRIALKVGEMKRIEFDVMTAGPGVLEAEIRGPSGHLPAEVHNLGTGRYVVAFTPQATGEHYLSVNFGGFPIADSPVTGYCESPDSSNSIESHEKVILTGKGLQEARVKQEAEFIIDGSAAGSGKPDVKLVGVKSHVDVNLRHIGKRKYSCTYYPLIAGAYLLNVKWGERDVRGSPFKINVAAVSDPSTVSFAAESLRSAVYGKELTTSIDLKKAGAGELTANCMGPSIVAFCELIDRRNGTYLLRIRPQEAGVHILQIKYNGQYINGCPYEIRVQSPPDASKVKVNGPGIEHGLLATYQSNFIVSTKGAGAGQLTVRVRGPKAAFRVEMKRETQNDRTILCKYDPTEVGEYIIVIKWSGDHIPGSPFQTRIFDTKEELEKYLYDHPGQKGNANTPRY